jgi:hypothetical protein
LVRAETPTAHALDLFLSAFEESFVPEHQFVMRADLRLVGANGLPRVDRSISSSAVIEGEGPEAVARAASHALAELCSRAAEAVADGLSDS